MKPAPDPDYTQHEGAYASLREKGADGWSSEEEYQVMLDLVAPLLPTPAGGPKLLELGCGAGNLSVALAGRGYAVAGVDISPTAVNWARERSAAAGVPATFQVDDVVRLASCKKEAFDVVVDGHCLHCIIGADRASCLEAVRRVLEPGGCLIVLTMCGEVLDERLLAALDPVARTVSFNGRPSRHIGTPESIAQEVVQAGFRIEHMEVRPRREAREQDDLVICARRSF